jgi:signal transduction histidine kinase
MDPKKINIFFLVSFLLIGNCLFASQPSAKPKPKLNYLDSLKVMAFINLGWKYSSSDYMIRSVSCADLAYYYAHEMKWKNGETEALLLKARGLDYLGKYKDALLIDLLALKTSIELKDSIQLARALRQTGGIYSIQLRVSYAIQLLNASIDISRKIKFSKGLGSALSDLASIYFTQANYKQAIALLNESILLKIKIHDSLNLTNSYRKLSMSYFQIGLYEKSIDYIFKSLKISNQIKNQKQQSFAYYQLGMFYTSTKEFGKSLYYLKKSLKIKKKTHDNEEFGMIYTRIGSLFSELHKPDSALKYLRNANRFHQEIGDEYLISLNNTELGNHYLQMQNYDSANFYLKKSMTFDSTQNISQYLITDYLLLTKNSYQHKKYQEAQNYLQKVSKLIDNTATLLNQSNYSELQSLIYEKLNNHKAAFAAYKKYILIRDSIYNQDMKTSIALKEAKFEFEKKALADSLKNQEQQRAKDLQINFQQSELQTQKIKEYTLSAGLLLLAGIGWLLYSRYKAVSKQHLAEQQLQLYENTRALEIERSRIAGEIHDDVGADLSNLLLKIRMNERLSETVKSSDLESLKKTTHNIIHKIDEIIWSLNSERDTLKELINFTSNYFETLLREHNLKGKINTPEHLPEIVLNTELRRNIFLTLKEIGNNALKYSKAQSINLNFTLQQNQLHITISDDGIGFDTSKTYNGNGIKNIKKRLEECNGSIHINSDATSGTSYKLIFPLIQNHPNTVV